MFRNIMVTALVAGAFVGCVLTALQLNFTSPLIIHAEAFENAGITDASSGAGSAAQDVPAHGDAAHNAVPHSHGTPNADGTPAWGPANGFERNAFTGLTTIVTAIGFGMLLISLMVIKGGKINGRQGVLWGLGGFAAMTLAPALGLAPELPTSAAAELGARQIWWTSTVVATAAGLGLMAFTEQWIYRLGGVALIALPHIVGAPLPETLTSTAPAELAGEFVGASIALSAIFWALLGWTTGTLWRRLNPDDPAPA